VLDQNRWTGTCIADTLQRHFNATSSESKPLFGGGLEAAHRRHARVWLLTAPEWDPPWRAASEQAAKPVAASTAANCQTRPRVGRRDASKFPRDQSRHTQAGEPADHDPSRNQPHAQNLARVCAHRHTHADLVRALSDGSRQHAVDTDAAQSPRQGGKHGDEEHVHTPQGNPVGAKLVQGCDAM